MNEFVTQRLNLRLPSELCAALNVSLSLLFILLYSPEWNKSAFIFEEWRSRSGSFRERELEREKTRAYSICICVFSLFCEWINSTVFTKQLSVPLKWKIFKRCKSKKYDSSSSIRPRKQRESNTNTNKRRTKTLSSSLVFSFTSLYYFALFFY